MRPASFLKDQFGWPWTRDWVGMAMHDPPFSVLTPKDGSHVGRAHTVPRIIYAAAKPGLADQLASGPKSAAEVAGSIGAHAPSLRRLMRALAGLGILTERAEQRYVLTTLGEALTSGAPGSARASILSAGSHWFQSAFDHIVYSIRSEKTGFEKAHGMSLFDYLSQNPEDKSLFSKSMAGVHSQEVPAIVTAYNFSTSKTIVDIGGATGDLLATILSRHPGPRGVLFDVPHVVAHAPALLEAKQVDNRVTIEGGDFFKAVPKGYDTYILSHLLHDWSEDMCLTILGHVRSAMIPDGRLLIIEMVLPPGDAPHFGKVLDIVMLVMTGGQERTEAEYRELLAKADLRLTRVVRTTSPVSIVEAVPA